MASAYTDHFRAETPAATRLARLRRLAWLIDAAFTLPGTDFRFGLNSLIGLLPFGGDVVLAVISLYIVYEAGKLGLPRWQITRMLGNVLFQVAAGSIPILGDMFDMALKANLRNLKIVEAHFGGWR
jgi:hypothetical protein